MIRPIILIMITLLQASAQTPFKEMADVVFPALTEKIPEVLECKKAYKSNNQQEALNKLLAYFRQRSTPRWFFSHHDQELLANGLRKNFPEQVTQHIRSADLLLSGKISWAGQDQPCGFPPDWFEQKKDEEYNEFLNRHPFLFDLGIAYWCTKDEKYARAYTVLMTDFIDKEGFPDIPWYRTKNMTWGPGPWNLLNTGIRIKNWLASLEFFLDSPSLSGDLLVRLLYSLMQHRAVLRYISPEIWSNADHNHYLMEMQGLLTLALMVPELNWTATADREFAQAQLERMRLAQVLEDGVQCEQTPGYHFGCIEWFGEPMLLGRLNDFPFSNDYIQNLRKMIEFATHITRPDGTLAPFGDSWPLKFTSTFALAGYLMPDAGLPFPGNPDPRLYLLAGGRLPTPDASAKPRFPLTAEFPKAGYYMMRSSWDVSALFLVLRNGSSKPGHCHADHLSFDLSAYGAPLIIEPGANDYQESPERRYFKSSAARNALTVDGKSSMEYLDRWTWKETPRIGCSGLLSDKNGLTISAWHEGFNPIRCTRKITFVANRFWMIEDTLTNLNQNEVSLYFHFQADKAKLLSSPHPGGGTAVLPDAPSIAVIQIEGESKPLIEEGWYSTSYGVKKPCKVLRLTKPKTAGVFISRTLLFPFPKGEKQIFTVKKSGEGYAITLGGSHPYQGTFLIQ